MLRCRPFTLLFFLLISLGLTWPVTAQIWTNVRVELINGSSLKGSIDSIDGDGNIRGDGFGQPLNLKQVTTIATDADPRKRTDQPLQLHLVDGGVVYGTQIELDEQQCVIQSASRIGPVSLENVRAMVWQESPTTADLIANPATDQDKVVVTTENGQRVVEGVLEGLDSTKVKLNYNGKSRSISFGKVRIEAIVVADLELPRPKGLMARVTLVDGSVVRGAIKNTESANLLLNTTGDRSIRIPVTSVARIAIQSSSIAFLASLEPSEVEQSVQFTVKRPWQRNQSVAGNPLSIRFAGSNKVAEFSNGLGTQSYTRLAFENEDGFDRFRATVGIDAETGGRGDCLMSVVGDGIVLWEKRVRGADDPFPVSVDITGMKTIELIVKPGEQFDLADHANWCDARFTKSE